jgi:hypothetical protein
MLRLLLDHPWPIGEVLDESSDAFEVLLEFSRLLARLALPPVPFLDEQQCAASLAQMPARHPAAVAVWRLSDALIHHGGSKATATPRPRPPRLSDCWRRALRDELRRAPDWRSPQIIVPQSRNAAWTRSPEVTIELNDKDSASVAQVLVRLNAYDDHHHALADMDPWRQFEWLRKPEPGAHNKHPCRLPRPPILEGVPPWELSAALNEARRLGWQEGQNYYFIPPVSWRPERVTKDQWRAGSIFQTAATKIKGTKRNGPVDYAGRIWSWHARDREWDVQLNPGYYNIKYNGRRSP